MTFLLIRVFRSIRINGLLFSVNNDLPLLCYTYKMANVIFRHTSRHTFLC